MFLGLFNYVFLWIIIIMKLMLLEIHSIIAIEVLGDQIFV